MFTAFGNVANQLNPYLLSVYNFGNPAIDIVKVQLVGWESGNDKKDKRAAVV